jgi:hypothetical protein
MLRTFQESPQNPACSLNRLEEVFSEVRIQDSRAGSLISLENPARMARSLVRRIQAHLDECRVNHGQASGGEGDTADEGGAQVPAER